LGAALAGAGIVCLLWLLVFRGGGLWPPRQSSGAATSQVAAELKKKWQARELLLPSAEMPGFSSEAVVVLAYLGRRQEGAEVKWPRVAFAIGDGTVLLTAAHCVTDLDEGGKQAVSAETVVISPYYGDVFEFEILAVDEKADLAVLKTGWPSHPALGLAGESELEPAREMLVAGYPQQEITKRLFRFWREIRMEKLPVRRVDEQKPDYAITLEAARFVGPGWSGSPMILPRSGKVAGVLGKLQTHTEKGLLVKRDVAGCSIRAINSLLDRSGVSEAAKRRPLELKPVENAQRAFSCAMEYVESCWNRDSRAWLSFARQLAELRPASVQARLFLAWGAQDAYTMDPSKDELAVLAESSFQEAVRLGPNSAQAHAGYGDFLMLRQRHKEALAETEAALAIAPGNDLALVNRMVILTRTDPAKAAEVGREMTDKHPKNAHYWFWYAGALLARDRNEEALAAARKAVDLNPDGLYRGKLAEALARVGRLDEAEACYKRMTVDCGCQQCWVQYAQFLIDHRSDKLEEAEKALETAKSKRNRLGVSKENLEKLRINLDLAKLQSLEKESPEKAEARGRQLLEGSPENGHYWFALAGILRTRGKHNEAVQAARQAVRLCPDFSYRPRLADTLAKAGQLEEAERTYKEMLRDHPERSKYWFWYAKFLNEYHPKRTEECREALSKAEAPSAQWSVSPDDLRELRARVGLEPPTKP
jgi:pentatricopeptide repeat protein